MDSSELTQQIVDRIYQDRKNRIAHPDGTFDSGGRWYPSEWEVCECCQNVRTPSRSYPYSQLVHCRTKKHIRNLAKNHGIKGLIPLLQTNSDLERLVLKKYVQCK